MQQPLVWHSLQNHSEWHTDRAAQFRRQRRRWALAGLIQASDGNFYGTTAAGGHAYGTVFKITASGTLTTLHSFYWNDGSDPQAGLVQARDGNFYGTTFEGGAYAVGTVFRLVLPRKCIVCRAAE